MKLTALKKVRVIFCYAQICAAYQGWAVDVPLKDLDGRNQCGTPIIIGGEFEIIEEGLGAHSPVPLQESFWKKTVGFLFPGSIKVQKPKAAQKPKVVPQVDAPSLVSDGFTQQQLESVQGDKIFREDTDLVARESNLLDAKLLGNEEMDESVALLTLALQRQTLGDTSDEEEDESSKKHVVQIEELVLDQQSSDNRDRSLEDNSIGGNSTDIVLTPSLALLEVPPPFEIVDKETRLTLHGKVVVDSCNPEPVAGAFSSSGNSSPVIKGEEHIDKLILKKPDGDSQFTTAANDADNSSEHSLYQDEPSLFSTTTVVVVAGISAIVLPYILNQWSRK